MSRLTPVLIKHMKYRLTEKVGSRGDGTLLFEKRNSGTIEAYYRYTHQGKEAKIKIGQYQTARDGHGYSLAECRNKAQNLARLRRECGEDLKTYLTAQETIREQQQAEEKRRQAIEASRGSFKELIDAYVSDQEQQEKESANQTRQALKLNVITAYPEIAAKKARDVTKDDIVTILRAIHNRGAEVESVRVRAILHACFNFGIKGDYDPTSISDKRFYIENNPVTGTKKNTRAAKVGERVLSHEEVKLLWETIRDTHRVGFILGSFIRFMLATAGQRPKQLLRARWEDYDFQRHCVTLIDRKEGNGTIKIHVVPLSQRALTILEEVRSYTGSYPGPFCSGSKGRAGKNKGKLIPYSLCSLKNGYTRYNKQLAEKFKSQGLPAPQPFTARDIRRTVKNILIDAGVNREQRNLLQSHAQTGIDIKHYDRHEHLPEKRESMRRYDAFLNKVLNGEEITLVDMEEYRQSTLKKKLN
ncbi:integrase family protein [Endozoicomonas sp. Mp262]|uniref:tyrosine-type recombinase/integrase n=1 Tax=Endozoicomonas sp. Mp262 TaxID=2919499 RepID=UPI0021DA9996